MTKKLLMGNEAMAFAALEAGVRVVAGYPGTPSSEIVETVARLRSSGTGRARVTVGSSKNADAWSTRVVGRTMTGVWKRSESSNAAFTMSYACSGVAGSSTGTFANAANRRVSCSVCDEIGPGSSATTSTSPPRTLT